MSFNKVYNHTSEDMHELSDESIHLMITSPPYNVGKEYEDDMSMEDYTAMLDRVWSETYRVLVPGGRACINVANIGRKPYIPLNAIITTSMIDIGFLMRGEIIWNKGASVGSSTAWGSWNNPSNPVIRDVHEYIMIFSKDRLDRISDKKSTIKKDDFLECTKSIWNIQTESAMKIGHPAPFPVEIPYRLIQLYSYENDVVLDPFMGSGTTAEAAIQSNRKFLGYEVSSSYTELANKRIGNETKFSEMFTWDRDIEKI